jgi:hypothetical protein
VIDSANIPAELRDRAQWVIWRSEPRNGKPTKVPYSPLTGQKASTTDPATWGTFETALGIAQQPGVAGIGFVFSPDDPYAGVDLDACFNGTGPHPSVARLLEELDSYTEISPSRTGLHVIVRAELNGSRHRASKTEWGGEFETYDRSRYFCVTGERYIARPIAPRQEVLDTIRAEMFPSDNGSQREHPSTTSSPLSDAELYEKIKGARNADRFAELWQGSDAGYASTSEADLAFLSIATFWTQDVAQLDRLFRASGRMRPEWDRDTYRQPTISKALFRSDYWTGERRATPAERPPDPPAVPVDRMGPTEPEPPRAAPSAPVSPIGDTDLRLGPQPPAPRNAGVLDGASFFLDAPERVEAVWGEGHDVLWARGEPFLLAGPDGVGKTTIAQQLALHMAGLGEPALLDLPVDVAAGKVFYVAADRPQQAARCGRRMVSEHDREILRSRLAVWKGPLPFDVVQEPEQLAAWLGGLGASVAFFDSLKDFARKVSEEETGHALNAAMQSCVRAGIDVCVLHHQRKAQGDNKKPKRLEDVYGSRWLTAGCGSVAMLWGEAGDPVVELTHLKQPADVVGPLELVHDNRAGTTTIGSADMGVVGLVVRAGMPVSVKDVARFFFQKQDPGRNEIEKARRRLEAAVEKGQLQRLEARDGEAARYQPLPAQPELGQ